MAAPLKVLVDARRKVDAEVGAQAEEEVAGAAVKVAVFRPRLGRKATKERTTFISHLRIADGVACRARAQACTLLHL